MRSDTAEAKRLIAAGANPNEGQLLGAPPLILTLMQQNADLAVAMIEKGADAKASDAGGTTTLMWAAGFETPHPVLVEELLRRGVDPNAKNKRGETALQWAKRRGSTPTVTALRKHGASEDADVKGATERAIALLQKSGPQFSKVSSCASCHHQSLPQMANALARERGYSVDAAVSEQQLKIVMAMYRPLREQMAAGKENLPDPAITVSFALLGLAAEGHKPDETTSAMAHLVSTQQEADGSFRVIAARPPMESTRFTGTALSLRALQLYGTQPAERVFRAAEWLRHATPKTNEERTMQLLGLAWAKATGKESEAAARALLKQQRPDGGWAQLPNLETDAYATGQALVALHSAGAVRVTDPAFQRAVGFLLRTQRPDGSWLVRSRSNPFQPYNESGFPYGKDQWISAAGTSWAAMALSLADPQPGQQLSRLF